MNLSRYSAANQAFTIVRATITYWGTSLGMLRLASAIPFRHPNGSNWIAEPPFLSSTWRGGFHLRDLPDNDLTLLAPLLPS